MFWPTLTHYGWAVSIRTAGQFVALQVDSFHHNGWRYWVRIRNVCSQIIAPISLTLLPNHANFFISSETTAAWQPAG